MIPTSAVRLCGQFLASAMWLNAVVVYIFVTIILLRQQSTGECLLFSALLVVHSLCSVLQLCVPGVSQLTMWSYYRCLTSDPGVITRASSTPSVIATSKIPSKSLLQRLADLSTACTPSFALDAALQEDPHTDTEAPHASGLSDHQGANLQAAFEPRAQDQPVPAQLPAAGVEFRCHLGGHCTGTLSVKATRDGPPLLSQRCDACGVPQARDTGHCSVCDWCVRQQDHHCVFLNNCVGEWNRKFFIQFLAYAVATGVFVLLRIAPLLWKCLSFTSTSHESTATYEVVMTPMFGSVWFNFVGAATCFVVAVGGAASALFYLLAQTFLLRRGRTWHTWIRELEVARLVARADPSDPQTQLLCVMRDILTTRGTAGADLSTGGGVDMDGTTHSQSQSPDSPGLVRNTRLVLGSRPLYWLLPLSLPSEPSKASLS